MRTCKKCGLSQPLEEFPIADAKSGVRRHECRTCIRARMHRYYQERPETYKSRANASYDARRKAWLKTPEGRAWKKAQASGALQAARKLVLGHYGGRCACCGESHPRFLTIDHVNDDGKEMRAEVHSVAYRFYRWLIRNNYPDGFQVLCFNCNIGRALNGGICPHKEGSTVIP
jgi:hypothetical protein